MTHSSRSRRADEKKTREVPTRKRQRVTDSRREAADRDVTIEADDDSRLPTHGASCRRQADDEAALSLEGDLHTTAMTRRRRQQTANTRAAAQPADNRDAVADLTPADVLAESPPTRRRKKLDIEDFSGQPSESAEVWLAVVPREAERQLVLDGVTWNSTELYHGASKHLKGRALRWLTAVDQLEPTHDRTWEWLAARIKSKFGRYGNMYETQLKIARRVQQPGERLQDYSECLRFMGIAHPSIPAYWYLETFLNGINNLHTSTLVRSQNFVSLADAEEYAVQVCGVYGEGLRIDNWRDAVKLYRQDRHLDEAEAAKEEKEAAELTDPLMKLLNEETIPQYDERGRRITGLAAYANDAMPTESLQAVADAVRIGHVIGVAAAAQLTRAEEMNLDVDESNAVSPDAEEQKLTKAVVEMSSPLHTGSVNTYDQPARSRSLSSISQPQYSMQPKQRLKKGTRCRTCGKRGHWHLECPLRR